MRPAKTAKGSHGGALPGAVGASLVSAVERALVRVSRVAVERNAVIGAIARSGAHVLTGIGGKGAPDLYVEVPTPSGVRAALWMECKSGEGELTDDQARWHTRASAMGRHVFVIRSVEHALAIVESFQRGEVFRGE